MFIYFHLSANHYALHIENHGDYGAKRHKIFIFQFHYTQRQKVVC